MTGSWPLAALAGVSFAHTLALTEPHQHAPGRKLPHVPPNPELLSKLCTGNPPHGGKRAVITASGGSSQQTPLIALAGSGAGAQRCPLKQTPGTAAPLAPKMPLPHPSLPEALHLTSLLKVQPFCLCKWLFSFWPSLSFLPV